MAVVPFPLAVTAVPTCGYCRSHWREPSFPLEETVVPTWGNCRSRVWKRFFVLVLHILLHTFGQKGLELSLLIGVNEAGVNIRMCICHAFCLFQPHHHECRGIGICTHAIFGDDGGRQDVVLYRITGTRVDGMRIFLSVFIVIVAIIARCGHAQVRDLQYGL